MNGFENIYADAAYAGAYAGLDWGGTYWLVRRDLPGILGEHVRGRRALDFGCGAGRSTRLLRSLGFEVTGVDIAESMIAQAKAIDAGGDYRLLADGDLGALPAATFDLVLAAFPFDNIPGTAARLDLLRALRRLLSPAGAFVNVVSSPEIYTHEWASFSTRDFPANRSARSGDVVRIVTTSFPGARPCEDVLCTDEAYREAYAAAGLDVAAACRPLGRADDGIAWITETRIPPWVIYVLRPP
jgi:SAM-dependent methyltransferase